MEQGGIIGAGKEGEGSRQTLVRAHEIGLILVFEGKEMIGAGRDHRSGERGLGWKR